MKKTNRKKGFTIIELVIVIAVIGILAAVLIPTFSNVIENANAAAAKSSARAIFENATIAASMGNVSLNGMIIESKDGNYKYIVTDGQLEDYEGTVGTNATTVDGGWKVYMSTTVSVEVPKKGSTPTWGGNEDHKDAEVFVAMEQKDQNKTTVLTVVDNDGNVYYSESVKQTINNGFFFYMYNTGTAWSNDAKVTPSHIKDRAAAAGWYSYTVKVDGVVTFSGVFYYA